MQMLRKSKATKLIAFLVMAILMVSMLAVPALAAEDTANTGIAGEVTATPAPTDAPVKTQGDATENPWIHKWGLDKEENQVKIPTVTTDDVNGWVERKGNDVISIAQTAGRMIAFIAFFVSIILIIVGALGNKRMMTGGFIAFVLSVLAYVALTYGKELMYLFSSWVMS